MTFAKPHRAAIYARTNQDPRSVSECRRIHDQIELCLTVAQSKGFSEGEIHVYKDEGLSGVAKTAPGLERLLSALCDYESVFVVHCSRISRNSNRAANVINQITASGAAIWACDPIREISAHSSPELSLSHRLRAYTLELECERRSVAAKRAHANRRAAKQAEFSMQCVNKPNQAKGD